MNFKEIFDKTGKELRLRFLEAIIRHNEGLQQEFINFTKQESTSENRISPESFLQHITETQEQYVSDFEGVDLENPDWDQYNPSHSGYIEEWEQYQQASEQEFEEIFDYFSSEALDLLIQQRIDDFTANLLGLYEACLNAEIEDTVGSFYDVNEHLTGEHKRIMFELIDKIQLSAISSYKVNSAIELFFYYCDENYPENLAFPKYFEPLLLVLADKSEQPGKVLSGIKKSKVNREAVPQLILLLNKNAGNSTEWLSSAQQFCLADNEVAKELLNYYYENDKPLFLKTAKELFQKDKHYWAEFLAGKMDLDLDKSMYINVFYQLTVDKKEIGHYRKIKTLLSPESFKKLIAEIKRDKVFLVKIYEEEKNYEGIKEVVQYNADSWDFEELISPVLSIYPGFCFRLIEDKTTDALSSNQRGRHLYRDIIVWLKLAKKIPGYENQTLTLIKKLYNHKPNLPALKDEFREAGLV